jgi:hypothetical protein
MHVGCGKENRESRFSGTIKHSGIYLKSQLIVITKKPFCYSTYRLGYGTLKMPHLKFYSKYRKKHKK